MLKTPPAPSAWPPGSVNSVAMLFTAVAVSAHEVVEAWHAMYLTPLRILHVSVPATAGQVARTAFSLGASPLQDDPPGEKVPLLAAHSKAATIGVVVAEVVVGVVAGVVVAV